MTTRGVKGARITSPDLQQSRQKADSAQRWRDRPDTFKTPFAGGHANVSTAQKEQPSKNFQSRWFLPIHLHRELLPQAVLEHTGRDWSRRVGWTELLTQQVSTAEGAPTRAQLWWRRTQGCTAAPLRLQCYSATPWLYLSLQQVRDICKNGNQTARMDAAGFPAV